MHREILEALKGQIIDHIDGNTLNNQRKNLRFCNYKNNRANSKAKSNSRTGYKGITWHKRDRIWQASIGVDGKYMYLGQFKTKEDAAKAYDSAAKKYFKEFANLNFPENKNGN